MKWKKPRPMPYFYVFFLLFIACQTQKYLGHGQLYYDDAEVFINENTDSVFVPSAIKPELNKLLIPKQKGRFMGFRLGVWCTYNHDRKGFIPFVISKLAKEPVFFDKRKNNLVSRNMLQYLKNNGFLDATGRYEVISKPDGGVKLDFRLQTKRVYTYRRISYSLDSLVRKSEQDEIREIGKLKVIDTYNLERLEKFRENVETYMKENGYYLFNKNNILFRLDSSSFYRTIRLDMGVKEKVQKIHFQKFKVGNIKVYPDFKIKSDTSYFYKETRDKDLIFLQHDFFIKRKVINQSIFLRPDSLFRFSKFQKSINRLSNLGVYKYVNVKQKPNNALRTVDFDFFLAPKAYRSVQAGLGLSTNSDGYTGPNLNLSYNNHNYFKGAEKFTSYLQTGILKQFGGVSDFEFIYWIGGGLTLKIPRMINFLKSKPETGSFVPNTIFDGSWLRYNFVPVITLDYISLSYGYQWQKNLKLSHNLKPLDWSYQKTPQNNAQLDSLKGKYPLLSQTFRNQLIIGSSYTSIYYSSLSESVPSRIRYSFDLNLSGNLIYFADKLFHSKEDKSFKILGLDYSQYVKVSQDFRVYRKIGKSNNLFAFRTIVGLGFPWGNSASLPFVQQYFIGGPNDIRAFSPRSLGPGAYDPAQDSTNTTSFFGQGGDIKLEMNLEWRFPIAGFLKGAVFTDFGNVWLSKLDTSRVGAEFNFNTFYKQIAVGVGLGFRLDFKIVLLRFDWAIPLRKPYIKEDDGWVINKINFGNTAWRKENLVFNLAIGYPF